MKGFFKDRTRVVVYGFLLFLILFLMFAWFTRKTLIIGRWFGEFDKQKGFMNYVTKCECVGIVRGGKFYGNPPSCLGVTVNCRDSSYWGFFTM